MPPPGGDGAHGQVLPLRPLTVGDILDGSFRLLRDRFGRLALLVLVVLGPFELVTALATQRIVPQLTDPAAPIQPDELAELDWGLYGGLAASIGVASVLVHVLVAGAIVWLVMREDAGERPSVGDGLRAAWRRSWSMVGAGLLLLLGGAVLLGAVVAGAIAIGSVALPVAVLLGLPAGLLLLATLSAMSWFLPPVAVVEQGGAVATAARVVSLVRRRFWRIVGIMLLLVLLLGIVSGIVGALLGVLALFAGPASWIVDAASTTALSVVMTPVTVLAGLLLYADARVRLEGWDLELRARQRRFE